MTENNEKIYFNTWLKTTEKILSRLKERITRFEEKINAFENLERLPNFKKVVLELKNLSNDIKNLKFLGEKERENLRGQILVLQKSLGEIHNKTSQDDEKLLEIRKLFSRSLEEISKELERIKEKINKYEKEIEFFRKGLLKSPGIIGPSASGIEVLINNQKKDVYSKLNFLEGSNITFAFSESKPEGRIDLTINSVGGGGGGSTTFLQLTDTPDSYANHGLELVQVDSQEKNLQFTPVSSLLTAGSGISLSGTTNVTITNTGVLSLNAGSGISITAGQNPTISNTGVLSVNSATGALTLQGTTNQVNVSTVGSTITLSTPQDIHTGATPTFAGLTLTGAGRFAVGSVSAPSITFADNTDTGFYEQTSGASGNIALSVNGLEVMRWNSQSSWGWNGMAPTTSNVITGGFTSTSSSLATYFKANFTYSPAFGTAGAVIVLDFTATSTVGVSVRTIVSKAELKTNPASEAVAYVANPVISTAVSSGTRNLVGFDFAPSAGAVMTGGTVNMYGVRVPIPPSGYSGSGGILNYYSYYSDAGHVILNESGGDYDVRIEGVGNANLFFLDASANAIGIGLNNPSSMLHVLEDVRARNFIVNGDTGKTGEVRFLELVANGTNYVGFKAPNNIASNVIWTLPSADGTAGQVLTTNGAGILSWTTISGGGGGGYNTIQEEGTSLPQRTIMNFIGSGLTAQDDEINSRTNITLDRFLADRKAPFYYTDFLGPAGAATVEAAYPFDFVAIGAGTQAKIAGEPNHPGILRISSSTTANSGGYVLTDITAFRIGGGEVFEIIFQPRVSGNALTTIRMGFLDTTSSADATDGVYFELPADSLDIVGKTANNNTRTTSSTIATLTVNTWYRCRIEINSDATQANFYVYNDSGTLLGSTSITTNIPKTTGRETGAGLVATNSGTTATLLAYFDFMAVGYNIRELTR